MVPYIDENLNECCLRGDIHYINDMGHINDLGYRSGRPGIIVSNNSANRHSAYVSIIPLTSQEKSRCQPM